jgi:hypothetical protein
LSRSTINRRVRRREQSGPAHKYNPNKKGGYNISLIREGVREAVMRAARLDTNPKESVPNDYATRVYLLMQEILPHFTLLSDRGR